MSYTMSIEISISEDIDDRTKGRSFVLVTSSNLDTLERYGGPGTLSGLVYDAILKHKIAKRSIETSPEAQNEHD